MTNSLLHDSSLALSAYRSIQSQKLEMRLNVFKRAAISKYGSIDSIKSSDGSPIESKTDIEIIEKLITLKTFITVPIFESNSGNSKCIKVYTVGLWYYWGLPELVIEFDTPVSDTNFINIIINILHDELFFMYKSKLEPENADEINRIDFSFEPNTIELCLPNFNFNLSATKLEDTKYMDVKAGFMMWFYMYYMDAMFHENDEPKLHPVYEIRLSEDYYKTVNKNVINKLFEKLCEFNESIDYESDSDSNFDLNQDQDH